MIPKKLVERAALIRAVRFFFEQRGYLEVETPVRNPVLIPEATIQPVSSGSSFLQTSPELCMKRLLATGYSQLFQICKCFRAQERGGRHLPEFTMLEWYRVAGDYQDLMAETIELLRFVVGRLASLPGLDGGLLAVLQQEPQFLTVAEAFSTHTGMSADEAIGRDCFDEVLVEDIEPHLGLSQPCFLYDYPLALGSLAKGKASDPQVVERFELYLRGLEVANGFSELTDTREQRRRFSLEIEQAGTSGQKGGVMPEKFLEDLALMPEACGIALGIDRLVMLVAGAQTIDEVVSFTPEEL